MSDVNQKPTEVPPLPQRRLRLTLDLGADSLADVVAALTDIAYWLEADGREERETTSGGFASGHYLKLTCDPEMDHDKYVEASRQWNERSRS